MSDDRFTNDQPLPDWDHRKSSSGKPTPEEIDRYLREVRKRLGIQEPGEQKQEGEGS